MSGRSLNAIIGLNGSVIEKGYGALEVQGSAALLDQCAYTVANPCEANFVVRAVQWKGVTTAGMRFGDTKTSNKPKCGIWTRSSSGKKRPSKRRKASTGAEQLRGRSKLPEAVEFTLVRPDCYAELSDEELQTELDRCLKEREAAAEAKRVEGKTKVMGIRRVKAQFWGAMPGKEDMFGRVPTVAASSEWKRREALEWRRDFVDAYRVARLRWVEGEEGVVFPAGTWQLRRRFGVKCESGNFPMLA